MKSIMNRLLAALLFAALLPVTASAQLLDDEMDKAWKPDPPSPSESGIGSDTPRIGMCLAGTTGLISVPTPEFQTVRKTLVSFKTGVTKRDILANDTKYDLEKSERWMSVAYPIKSNLEVSLNHLAYERSSSPHVAPLNYSEDSTGFGMKYSTRIDSQTFCFGGVFAPMSAVQINNADLVQIENLRTVYLTMGEKLSEKLRGYLNLKHCFTDDQKIVFPSGRTLSFDKKEFLVSAIALDYAPVKNVSIMLESQFMNYRDFYKQEGDRISINAGVRGGSDTVQAEIFMMSLNVEPDFRFGLNFGF